MFQYTRNLHLINTVSNVWYFNLPDKATLKKKNVSVISKIYEIIVIIK